MKSSVYEYIIKNLTILSVITIAFIPKNSSAAFTEYFAGNGVSSATIQSYNSIDYSMFSSMNFSENVYVNGSVTYGDFDANHVSLVNLNMGIYDANKRLISNVTSNNQLSFLSPGFDQNLHNVSAQSTLNSNYQESLNVSRNGISGGIFYDSSLTSIVGNQKNTSTYSIGSIPATFSNTPININAGNPTIPIPAAFWMLGSGLIGLVGVKRKIVV